MINRQLCWICGSQVWACVCGPSARHIQHAAVEQLVAIIRIVVPLAAAAQEVNTNANYWHRLAIQRGVAHADATAVLSQVAAERDQLQDALSAACDSLGEVMLALGARPLLLRPLKNEALRARIAARGRTDAQLAQIAADAFEAAALLLAELGQQGAAVFTCAPDDGHPITQMQSAPTPIERAQEVSPCRDYSEATGCGDSGCELATKTIDLRQVAARILATCPHGGTCAGRICALSRAIIAALGAAS